MRLRVWRIKKGITIADVSKKTDIPESTLYDYERGAHIPPLERRRIITKLTKGAVQTDDFEDHHLQYKRQKKMGYT